MRSCCSFSVIYNPCAGAGRAQAALEDVRAITEQFGGQLIISRGPGHATHLAQLATKNKNSLVFAAGGDDTIRETLKGINRSPDTRFGIVPVGTFNNFATSLHLPEDPVAAFRSALEGRDYAIDLGKVEQGHYFIESVGIGIDSEAWSRAPIEEPIGVERWFTGIRVGFATLAYYLPKHLNIVIDGRMLDIHDVMQVIVANASCFGARLQMAPQARLDDGLLDICIIPLMSKAKLLSALPLFFYGKQQEYLPSLRFYQGKRITISARRSASARVDGLLAAKLPITLRAIPNALQVRLPNCCFGADGMLI